MVVEGSDSSARPSAKVRTGMEIPPINMKKYKMRKMVGESIPASRVTEGDE